MLEDYIETNKGLQTGNFNAQASVASMPLDFSETAYMEHLLGDDVLVERLKGTAANTAISVLAALGAEQLNQNLRSEFGTQSGSGLRGKAASSLFRTISDMEDAGIDTTSLRRLTARRTKGARARLHNEPKELASGLDYAYNA